VAVVNTVAIAVDTAAEAAGTEDVIVTVDTAAADHIPGCCAKLEERHLELEGYSG